MHMNSVNMGLFIYVKLDEYQYIYTTPMKSCHDCARLTQTGHQSTTRFVVIRKVVNRESSTEDSHENGPRICSVHAYQMYEFKIFQKIMTAFKTLTNRREDNHCSALADGRLNSNEQKCMVVVQCKEPQLESLKIKVDITQWK